jgi:hypothetical protein
MLSPCILAIALSAVSESHPSRPVARFAAPTSTPNVGSGPCPRASDSPSASPGDVRGNVEGSDLRSAELGERGVTRAPVRSWLRTPSAFGGTQPCLRWTHPRGGCTYMGPSSGRWTFPRRPARGGARRLRRRRRLPGGEARSALRRLDPARQGVSPREPEEVSGLNRSGGSEASSGPFRASGPVVACRSRRR